MVSYTSGPVLKHAATFGGIQVKAIVAFLPVLTIWGAAGAFGIATFTEHWPLFQKTFYSKIPFLGQHWIHNPDPQDLPQ